jgi:hypothetical protein
MYVAWAVCIFVGFLQSNLLVRQLTPELKSSIEVTPTAKINSEQKKSRKSNTQGAISFCFTEAGGSRNMQNRMLPSSFAKGRSEFPSSPK